MCWAVLTELQSAAQRAGLRVVASAVLTVAHLAAGSAVAWAELKEHLRAARSAAH